MKVFISGPMKGYLNFNKEAFDQAEKELIQQGYTVFNPSWMDFSGEWTRQDKRAIDAAIMSRCDAVYQLPGWFENGGSRMEHAFAQTAGMIFLGKDAEGFFFVINKEAIENNG